ncbi:hypothetical protein ACFCYX_38810 [Streptomyces populi]|uniref:hypothetical protein n=1 Tax=Streptomyces populi TaxID=2058924 RepID=UPI0035D52F95
MPATLEMGLRRRGREGIRHQPGRLLHHNDAGSRYTAFKLAAPLGDATHLMFPFAGEGADLAMLDGAGLAQAVAAHPGDREAALAAYEEALFPPQQGVRHRVRRRPGGDVR